MRNLLIIILVLALFSPLLAETVSTKKAMFFSLILPGSGELYAKSYNKAAGFFCTEAAILLSYFRLKQETNWAVNSYKQFAITNAGIPQGQEDSYFQRIQDFESSELYNSYIIRDARNYFLIYKNDPVGYENYLDTNLISEDLAWDWQNSQNWIKYKELRRQKQDLEIYTKFTFAAAILNRIVSFVDAAVTAKNYNKSGKEVSSLHIDPDWKKRGVKVYYEYKF